MKHSLYSVRMTRVVPGPDVNEFPVSPQPTAEEKDLSRGGSERGVEPLQPERRTHLPPTKPEKKLSSNSRHNRGLAAQYTSRLFCDSCWLEKDPLHRRTRDPTEWHEGSLGIVASISPCHDNRRDNL